MVNFYLSSQNIDTNEERVVMCPYFASVFSDGDVWKFDSNILIFTSIELKACNTCNIPVCQPAWH